MISLQLALKNSTLKLPYAISSHNSLHLHGKDNKTWENRFKLPRGRYIRNEEEISGNDCSSYLRLHSWSISDPDV